MATLKEVRDSLCGQFKTVWDADTPALLPTPDPPDVADPIFVVWDGTEEGKIPDNIPWARCSIIRGGSDQMTLSPPGERIYERWGHFFIQLFSPRGKGHTLLDSMIAVALKAVEGFHLTTSDFSVWTKTAEIRDEAVSGTYLRANVVVEFCWRELK